MPFPLDSELTPEEIFKFDDKARFEVNFNAKTEWMKYKILNLSNVYAGR